MRSMSGSGGMVPKSGHMALRSGMAYRGGAAGMAAMGSACGCGGARSSSGGCARCGGGGVRHFPPARYNEDGSCAPITSISCDTRWRVRECFKVAFCDLLRCLGDQLCDESGRFDEANKPDFGACLETFVCSVVTCLPTPSAAARAQLRRAAAGVRRAYRRLQLRGRGVKAMTAKTRHDFQPCVQGAFEDGLSRTAFFDGMVLTEGDMVREQSYWRGKRKLTNRALGQGVVWGLAVHWDSRARQVLP